MRLGDFYEVFGDNAVTLANELDLTLTGRDFAAFFYVLQDIRNGHGNEDNFMVETYMTSAAPFYDFEKLLLNEDSVQLDDYCSKRYKQKMEHCKYSYLKSIMIFITVEKMATL